MSNFIIFVILGRNLKNNSIDKSFALRYNILYVRNRRFFLKKSIKAQLKHADESQSNYGV